MRGPCSVGASLGGTGRPVIAPLQPVYPTRSSWSLGTSTLLVIQARVLSTENMASRERGLGCPCPWVLRRKRASGSWPLPHAHLTAHRWEASPRDGGWAGLRAGPRPHPSLQGAACAPASSPPALPPAAAPEPRAADSLASSAVGLDPDGTRDHRLVPASGGVPGFGPQAPVFISEFQLPRRSSGKSALLMG